MLNPARSKPDQPAPDIEDLRAEDDYAFLRKCLPALETLEDVRLLKKRAYEWRKKIAYPGVLIGAPVCGYLDYLLLWFQRNNDDGGAGLTFLFLGAVYWWVTVPKREYARAYKIKMLPEIARAFGNFLYDIDRKIDIALMQASKIMPSYDRYRAEDYFKGTYKGVDIEFSEIHLTETRGSGKNRRRVTTFKGLAILLAMKAKRFYGHTILDHNSTGFGEWVKEKTSGMKRARMADPEFEKVFDAYTTDQVEARYLLDPLMIERLKTLYEQYTTDTRHKSVTREPSWIEKLRVFSKNRGHAGQNLRAAFYGNKMLILINSRYNHFEPPDIHIPATDSESLLQMKREIGDILSIIDRLEVFDPRALRDEPLN